MHVRIDAGGVVTACARLGSDADAARRLAALLSAQGHADVDRLDDSLVQGLRVVGEICRDVLEVVGLDLDVLAAKALAGTRAYDTIERAVLHAAGEGHGPR